MLIKFGQYKDNIWCDVVPIDVRHMILGRPWLYDLNATLYSRINTCVVKFKGKKIKLTPLSLKTQFIGKSPVNQGNDVKDPQSNTLNILSLKEFVQEVQGNAPVFVIVAKAVTPNHIYDLSAKVEPFIREF